MEKFGGREKTHNLWYGAALLVPVVQAASNQTWAAALAMGFAALILGKWSRWGTGWVLTVEKLWAAIMAGTFMQQSGYFWGGLPFAKITPFILLVLAVWTVAVPEKGQRIGCVMIWPIIFLLGAVLVSGISDVKLKNLSHPSYLPEGLLLAVLLIPGYGRSGRVRWKLALGAVVVAVITAGVLSPGVSTQVPSGIYELSRSLSLLGVAERFESLVAAAMTLGFYAGIVYLLDPGEKKDCLWAYAGIAALLCLLNIRIGGWILVAGSVLSWVILPLTMDSKNNGKNRKKGIDKT